MEPKKYWIVPGITARYTPTGERVRILNVIQATYRNGEQRTSRIYGVNCEMIDRRDKPVSRVHTRLLSQIPDTSDNGV